MSIASVWIRRVIAAAVIVGSASAAGCAGQGLDARPSMFGATCVPGDRDATATASPMPGASLHQSVELMPVFAATCRPGFDFTRVELVMAERTEPRDWLGFGERLTFDFAMFGASCSPAQRGFAAMQDDVRVADVPVAPE